MAQSRLCFFFDFTAGAPVAGAGGGGGAGEMGVGITVARAVAWDERTPCDAECSTMRSAAAGAFRFLRVGAQLSAQQRLDSSA